MFSLLRWSFVINAWGLLYVLSETVLHNSILFNYLFTASKKDDDLLLKVTSQEREKHVNLLMQLTHHVVLFQSGRGTAEKIIL